MKNNGDVIVSISGHSGGWLSKLSLKKVLLNVKIKYVNDKNVSPLMGIIEK
jgi:hypothetical protein